MPRRSDSRRRMLDAAAELFRTDGYHATGLARLLEAGGAPKGSFYFHFPGGKEQLAVEAVRESAQRVRDRLTPIVRDAPDAPTAVAAVIDHFAAELSGSGFRGGCPIAGVALDAAGGSEVIARACTEGYRSWRDALERVLRHHGVAADAATPLAEVVLAAAEGALLLARTERDLRPLHVVREHLRVVIAAAT